MLTRRTCLQTMLGGLAAPLTAPLIRSAEPPKRPNILVIVSDDQGYGDVSSYKHPKEVNTPQMDRLANRGIRFIQGYAGAYVCAPSRAAILTGTYQQRYGFYTAADSRVGLPLSQTTMADMLKKEGYRTCALGKWHLGIDLEHHPMKRGFDEYYGFLGNGAHDYFDLKPTGKLSNSILRGYEPIDETGYLTDDIGREAVNFIGRNEENPFFLYIAFNAVHSPMEAPQDVIKKYDTGNEKRNILMAMLERENDAIGKVMDELQHRKLDDNTLVVFVSDNGGARNNASNNGDLRDYKQSVYEGGIRIPYMVSWPGHLKPKSVSNEPVTFMDIMPTVAAAVGAQMPPGREGRNMLPILTGKAKGPLHECLFWDGAEEKTAVRCGPWKLVNTHGKVELFNLEEDLGEKNDLSTQKHEIVADLQAKFAAWTKGNAPRIGTGSDNDDDDQPGAKKGGKKAAKKKGE